MSEYSLPHTEQLNGLSEPIHIVGVANENAKRMEFNVFDNQGEYLLHYNIRFDEGVCVRNSTKSGQQWEREERDGGMPFRAGKEFTLEINADDSNVIHCVVNNFEQCIFRARGNSKDAAKIEISGDLQLKNVSVSGGENGGSKNRRDVPQPQQEGGRENEGGVGGDFGGEVHLQGGDDEPEPNQPEPQEPQEPEPQQPEPHMPPPREPEPQHPEPEEPRPQQPQPDRPQPNIVRPPPDHRPEPNLGGGFHHPQEPLPDLPQPPHPTQGELNVPYNCPLEDFTRTHRLRVVGTPIGEKFEVIMRLHNGDALFHFNPRLNQNCVFRNATNNMQWQPQWEDKSGNGCPFNQGQQFALDLIANGNVISCFVDGVEYCKYPVHGDINQVHILQVNGDVQLNQVLIE